MQDNALTVIIPHYNSPQLLSRCLNSIPDEPWIKVIVVDNNSSPEVVDFNDFPGVSRANTTCIFDKEGRGAGQARNVGLRLVDTKWVIFADSDDFFTVGAFDEISKYLSSDADIVMFKINVVDSDTLEPACREGDYINRVIDYYLANKLDTNELAFFNQAPWAKLISSKIVGDNKIQFDEVKYANDIMFSTILACTAGKVFISSFPLYSLTLRQGSLTSSNKTSVKNFICRLNVRIRRNLFLKERCLQQTFLGIYLLEAKRLGKDVFWKTLSLLFRNKMLFAGFGQFVKYEFMTKILKREYYIW